MLLKTKLLFTLGSLGVAGGTGAGIYYLKQQNNQEIKTKQTEHLTEGSEGNPKGDSLQPETPSVVLPTKAAGSVDA